MATQLENAPSIPDASPALAEAPVQQLGMKERFYLYFQQEVIVLQEQIDHLVNFALVGGERQDAIDHCLAGIARLSSEVSKASHFLPAYDQRTYSQAVKALSEKLQETRAKIAPKPRFVFKTQQKNSSAISLTDAAELAQAQSPGLPKGKPPGAPDSSIESSLATTPAQLSKDYNAEIAKPRHPPGEPIRKPSFSQASNVSLSNHTGLHIILPSSASRATASSSCSLTHLTRCIVDMSAPTTHGAGAPFAGLMLKSIVGSVVAAGRVAGAAHITGVENGVIAVAARQVRMHECRNVDVYLMCASRPIIENCTGVRFAPLPECYKSTVGEENNETLAKDQWDQIDDFKWLKAEHSPNWSILPEAERLPGEVWTTVVPGGRSMGLDDILRKVGIKA